MKRLTLIVLCLALVAVVVLFKRNHSVSAVGQGETITGNDVLLIEHREIFGSLERPPVLFDHGLHERALKAEGCGACHHETEGGNLIFAHIFVVMPKEKSAVRDSYHAACVSCHEERIQKGKDHGPVTCGECHDKRRSASAPAIPSYRFDFFVHDKHVRALAEKCENCHHRYDKEEKELVYEAGTEQSCLYCHELGAVRGPFFASELSVVKEKGYSLRTVSHSLCVNCHRAMSKEQKKAGPLACTACHTGKYRTVQDMRDVPRPEREQPLKPRIAVEGAKMKAVVFDHESHQKSALTCRVCHHEALESCTVCHSLVGTANGKRVTAANAFHDIFSERSCAGGCHAEEKARKECSGCHHHMLSVDTQTKGPKREYCAVCHSGDTFSRERTGTAPRLVLDESKVPENVTISILEREYEPSTFPHRKIVRRLMSLSNDNAVARAFHRNSDTICDGCHHQSVPDAEAEKQKPPFCRSCHAPQFDAQNLNRPRLIAAYHRQCLGCHRKMQLEQTGCADCHEEKKDAVPALMLDRNGDRGGEGG